MTSFSAEEQNLVLDHLIGSRRTVRKFKNDIPPRSMIEEVLQAGMLAPYTQLLVTREDFRRFVVIPRESEATAKAASLIKRRAVALYHDLERKIQQDGSLKDRGNPYLGRLKMVGPQSMPILGKAPYYIVVADQKGIPEVAGQAIAHCLQNMWLKSTALGLGFQLLSITEEMADDREFCELIGIPFGEYALDGCLIGYPDASPAPSKRPASSDVTRWL
ncbi:MAG: nitroreductase family protein [Methanomassiliicoccales archaeon]|nr:nitroreductase family protein [Methanomassiliicoccales archaeon]